MTSARDELETRAPRIGPDSPAVTGPRRTDALRGRFSLVARLRPAGRNRHREAEPGEGLPAVEAAFASREIRLITHQVPGAASNTWYAVALPSGLGGATRAAVGSTRLEAAQNLLREMTAVS